MLRLVPASAVLLLLLPALLRAAPYSLGNTEVQALPRSANGRDYTLYVGLPSSYASSPSRHYPVVYACDGYWDFPLLLCEVGNLTYDGAIPECIVVGISYTGTAPDYSSLRAWDLTPGYDPYGGANTGHAQEFLTVIADEFIPFIEGHYRADPTYRVLTGSSYGGLFTVYALFERPGLFQAYVAPSPSLWWRDRYLLAREREFRPAHLSLSARLYLTYAGDESAAIRDSTRFMAAQLRQAGYTGLAVAVREIEGERHSGTKGESFNRGLRFAFAPLAPSPAIVSNPGYGSRSPLVNVSTRGRVGRGDDVLIAGFVIDGPEPKRVLIRGVGPTLSDHGIAAPLSDPQVHLYNAAQQLVASNDNWPDDAAGSAALISAAAQTGASPLRGASRDAALLVRLEPGVYTAVVSGVEGAEGIALAEVYEVLP